MSAAPTFDPIAYKNTTREQWQAAAEAWHRWGPFLEEWLGPATDVMLDMAGVKPGSRVLDVAAGAGGQTLATARRAGPQGRVVATDISPRILEFAAAEAKKAGLNNVETLTADGESLNVEPGSFDAAISRVGLIYFPDQQRALRGILAALKPGGRFGAIVYSTPENNAFFSGPVSIIRQRAALPPPAPGQPGPFSLGKPGVLEETLSRAGFRNVEARTVASPLRMNSAAECTRFERESFGALHQMMTKLPEADRLAVWRNIEAMLRQFERGGRFEGPCELIVAVGVKERA